MGYIISIIFKPDEWEVKVSESNQNNCISNNIKFPGNGLPIKPCEFTINELFGIGQTDSSNENGGLSLPDFQRPYRWSFWLAEKLVEDLVDALNDKKELYLLGNMILYLENKSNETYENSSNGSQADSNKIFYIVDGQQRIITLSIILSLLSKGNEEKGKEEIKIPELKITHPLSVKNIIEIRDNLQKRFGNLLTAERESLRNFILDNVKVTALITNDLDIAFFLFDSHNTRGKALRGVDLLKVHHLRLVDEKEKQEVFARKWEEYDKETNRERKGINLLEEVLDTLTIIRKGIRGELEGDDLLNPDEYKEFIAEINRKLAKSEDEKIDLRLNNYTQPPLFENFSYKIKNGEEKIHFVYNNAFVKAHFPYPVIDVENSWRFIPFPITMSVVGGEWFFYYVIKFVELYKTIIEDKYFSVFDDIKGGGNYYLRKFYKALLFQYYDKFGERGYKEFALLWLIRLAIERICKKSIRRDGVVKVKFYDYREHNNEFSPFLGIMLKDFPELVHHLLKNSIEMLALKDDYSKGCDVDNKSLIDELKQSTSSSEKGKFLLKYKELDGDLEIAEKICRELGRYSLCKI